MTVLIAGAGPSGSRLAANLAKGGVNVILVDRINTASQQAFSSAVVPISALEEELIPSQAVSTYCKSWQIICPNENLNTWSSDRAVGVVLDFAKLREGLWKIARSFGVEMLIGWTVKAVKSFNYSADVFLTGPGGVSRKIKVRWVVDATGFKRSLIGLPSNILLKGDQLLNGYGTEWILKGNQYTQMLWNNRMTFVLGSELIPYGYGWIFPMANNQLKVGICSLPPPHIGTKDISKSLKRLLFKYELSELKVLDKHGGIVSSTLKRSEPHHKGRIIGVGDAVSTANILGGEGIRHAIASSDILAPLILETYKHPAVELEQDCLVINTYKNLLRRHFGWRWSISSKIARRTWWSLSSKKADLRICRLVGALAKNSSAEDISALLFDYRFERFGFRLMPYLFGWR